MMILTYCAPQCELTVKCDARNECKFTCPTDLPVTDKAI